MKLNKVNASDDSEERRRWSFVLTRLREIFSLILVFAVIYLIMSLASFDHNDSAWTFLNNRLPKNSGGPVGAWLADILFTGFGRMTWLFVLLLLGGLCALLRKRGEPLRWKSSVLYIQFPAFCFLLFASCALSALYWDGGQSALVSGGGIAGQLLLELFLPAFGIQGSTLFLVAIVLLGFTLLVDFSWFALMDRLGIGVLTSFSYLKKSVLWLFSFFVVGVKALAVMLRRKRGSEGQSIQKNPRLSSEKREPVIPMVVPECQLDKAEPSGVPVHPVNTASLSTMLLDRPQSKILPDASMEEEQARAKLLEEKLRDFGVDAVVVAIQPGPVVTRFEIQPAPGLKVNKISGLATDLARSLSVVRVRVVEVIPGKSVVGIEVPNAQRQMVYLSEVVESRVFSSAKSSLSLILGQDISGEAVVVDLAKMPHLLVAGTTGSGKSVGVNAMILSLLYKASPAEVRLIMVDPKMLELSVYEGIPHLLTPVVTDMKEAAGALRWCVMEMERRYKLMAALGVRNITGYNEKVKQAKRNKTVLNDPNYQVSSSNNEVPVLDELPFIVVVIDEFADMMMIVGKKVEELIARIAQKARAAGIHLILATQRPSVDVITGLIKANVPARISFQVSSKVDSRTIIDQSGAEQLLGQGDMLYLPPGTGLPVRVHGAFVSDEEVHRVVADWKSRGEPEYIEEILHGDQGQGDKGSAFSGGLDAGSEQDELYDDAVAFVTQTRKASVSAVQRQFRIGYNRAANLVESMERAGVVTPAGNNGAREVLVSPPPE